MISVEPFLHTPIEGLKLAQNHNIDECFKRLKNDYGQPIHIIEIGTCWGGFAVFLKKMFPDADVHTFDIINWGDADYINKRNDIYAKLGIYFHKEDCFLNEGAKIINLLKQKSILLCDGGLKESEFSRFINHTQPGSIIMAHDYGKSKDWYKEFIAGKYWGDSFEFDGSKFDDECTEKGFTPYLQDDFDRAVWYIRKNISTFIE